MYLTVADSQNQVTGYLFTQMVYSTIVGTSVQVSCKYHSMTDASQSFVSSQSLSGSAWKLTDTQKTSCSAGPHSILTHHDSDGKFDGYTLVMKFGDGTSLYVDALFKFHHAKLVQVGDGRTSFDSLGEHAYVKQQWAPYMTFTGSLHRKDLPVQQLQGYCSLMHAL